jgi:glucans biosynthesis protein
VTVYGLLDSPSVAGAYRFIIDVADTIEMDVDAALYPRKTIERLGIAPGTSMFLDGPNDRRDRQRLAPGDSRFRRLQLYNGNGEWLWRPLVNPAAVHVNSFVDESPRGFG